MYKKSAVFDFAAFDQYQLIIDSISEFYQPQFPSDRRSDPIYHIHFFDFCIYKLYLSRQASCHSMMEWFPARQGASGRVFLPKMYGPGIFG